MLDQAQLMSLVQHLLTAAGAALAGTWLAQFITPGIIEVIAGVIVVGLATLWGNRSSTPEALAAKLVANPAIDNKVAAKAIETGQPEKVTL